MSKPITYEYPEWYYKTWKQNVEANLSSDQIAILKEEGEKINKYNQENFKETCQSVNLLKFGIGRLYGTESKLYKYFLNNGNIENPPDIEGRYRDLLRAIATYQKDQKELEYKLNKVTEDTKLLERAIVWLHSRGFIIGSDFRLETAIKTANDIRFEELKEEKLSSPNLYDFNGGAYCEDCAGWDGESRRCECGNRRVSWESEGNFEDMYLYGEAY